MPGADRADRNPIRLVQIDVRHGLRIQNRGVNLEPVVGCADRIGLENQCGAADQRIRSLLQKGTPGVQGIPVEELRGAPRIVNQAPEGHAGILPGVGDPDVGPLVAGPDGRVEIRLVGFVRHGVRHRLVARETTVGRDAVEYQVPVGCVLDGHAVEAGLVSDRADTKEAAGARGFGPENHEGCLLPPGLVVAVDVRDLESGAVVRVIDVLLTQDVSVPIDRQHRFGRTQQLDIAVELDGRVMGDRELFFRVSRSPHPLVDVGVHLPADGLLGMGFDPEHPTAQGGTGLYLYGGSGGQDIDPLRTDVRNQSIAVGAGVHADAHFGL